MAEKEIKIIERQLERLAGRDFDLDAWKTQTILLLEPFLGENNPVLRRIANLHYDYSSWSLRDTVATTKSKDADPVRVQAREILEALLEQIKTMGLPPDGDRRAEMLEIVADELTGNKRKELEALLASSEPEKEQKVAALFAHLDKETLARLLSKLLVS